MKFRTESDMGDVKVYSNGMSAFFANGFGDGVNEVTVVTDEKKRVGKGFEFLGHFTAKKANEVFLSSYDCGDDPIHTFGKGRWFVYLKSPQKLVIAKCDDELHS